MSYRRTAAFAALFLTAAFAGCHGPHGNMRLPNPFPAWGKQAAVEPSLEEPVEAVYASWQGEPHECSGDDCSCATMTNDGS